MKYTDDDLRGILGKELSRRRLGLNRFKRPISWPPCGAKAYAMLAVWPWQVEDNDLVLNDGPAWVATRQPTSVPGRLAHPWHSRYERVWIISTTDGRRRVFPERYKTRGMLVVLRGDQQVRALTKKLAPDARMMVAWAFQTPGSDANGWLL